MAKTAQQYKFKVYGNETVDTDSLSRAQWISDTTETLRAIDTVVVNRLLQNEKIHEERIANIRYDYVDGSRVPSNHKVFQDAFRSQRTTDVFLKGQETPIRAIVVLRFDPDEQAFSTSGNIYVNETFGDPDNGYFAKCDGQRVYSMF